MRIGLLCHDARQSRGVIRRALAARVAPRAGRARGVFVRGGRLSGALACVSLSVTLSLSLIGGCASHATTADTVLHDAAVARQQAEQAPAAPDDRNLYLTLIGEMQAKGLAYASLAHIDAFEKKYGARPDIELLRGDALRETGQDAAALAVYQSLADDAKAGAPAWHGIGRVLAAQHRYPAALDALGTAVTRDPTNVAYLNDLAYADLLAGRTAAARVPLAQAAELAPRNNKVIANLVLYLLLNGDAAGAQQVIARAALPEATVQATRTLAAQLGTRPAVAPAATASMSAAPLPAASVSSASSVSSAAARTLSPSVLERFGVTQ
ncbi:MAG: pilus assembly protein [Janthinobacterium lividum]